MIYALISICLMIVVFGVIISRNAYLDNKDSKDEIDEYCKGRGIPQHPRCNLGFRLNSPRPLFKE